MWKGEPQPLHTDKNNLAPRVGFSWTPSADAKTVVRGGFGLYYSQINGQIPNLACHARRHSNRTGGDHSRLAFPVSVASHKRTSH